VHNVGGDPACPVHGAVSQAADNVPQIRRPSGDCACDRPPVDPWEARTFTREPDTPEWIIPSERPWNPGRVARSQSPHSRGREMLNDAMYSMRSILKFFDNGT
jgi:hypothetical protein